MENYVLYDEIGRGSGTVVYKGRRKGTINFVAIYCIEKGLRPEITNRVRLTHELQHEHVVAFHEWYETSNHLWIVVELCTGGTLANIVQQDQCLPESVIRPFARCVLRALYYLHSLGIVFANLTPAKILLDGSGQLKLSDFTLARVQGEDLLQTFQQTLEDFGDDSGEVSASRVTPTEKAYAAPEVLQNAMFSPASDLWSLGCVIYEMFAGTPPFSASDDLVGRVASGQFPSPRAKPLSPNHTEKPSAELASLIKGLLHPDPTKRLDWTGLMSHPFWKGSCLGETMDRPVTLVTGEESEMEEQRTLRGLNDTEVKVNSSLMMTAELRSSLRPKTGEQDPQLTHAAHPAPNHDKPSADGKGGSTARNASRSSATPATGNTTARRAAAEESSLNPAAAGPPWKQLIYTSTDLTNSPIVDNPKIAKPVALKFDGKQLPTPVISVERLKQMTEEQVRLHLKPLVEVLSPPEKNNSLHKNKLNVVAYLCSLAGADCVANLLINEFRLLNEVVGHIKSNSLAEMRVKYCRLVAVLALGCSVVHRGTNLMEVIVTLTEVLRDNFRNGKMKQSVLPAIGELLFLIATQEHKHGSSIDSWTIPTITFTMVSRCLREGEDPVTQHLAAKIVENMGCTGGGVHASKFATTEVTMLLWNVFLHSSSDAIKVTSICAVTRMNSINGSLFPSVIDKAGLPSVLDTLAVNCKVQQAVLTMLLDMVASGQHLSRLASDKNFVGRVMRLLDSSFVAVRAKAFLLLSVVADANTEMLVHMCGQRLVVYIERDYRKIASARPDTASTATGGNQQQYLNLCLDQLILTLVTVFPVILQDVAATLDGVSGRKHPSTLHIKQLRATLPLFSVSSQLLGSQLLRQRILDTDVTMKLGQLLSHVHSIESGETCIDAVGGGGGAGGTAAATGGASSLLGTQPSGGSLSEDFKKTCLTVAEIMVHHPQIVMQFSKEMVQGFLPPLSQMMVDSDNGDIRLMCTVLVSELTAVVVGYDASSSTEAGELHAAVYANFRDVLLPGYEQLLICPDPMPAYALKLLTVLIENSPAIVGELEKAGVVPVLFDVLNENCDNVTGNAIHSLISIFNSFFLTRGSDLDTLYELGLGQQLYSVLMAAVVQLQDIQTSGGAAQPREKDLKSVLPLLTVCLETVHNILKHASNVVRVTLQQKNANKDTDTSQAEQLLAKNKIFVKLMSSLIMLLGVAEADIVDLSCNILFMLVQLYGGATDDDAVTSEQSLIGLADAIRSCDVKKQRVLLRFFKRVVSSDANHAARAKQGPGGTAIVDVLTSISELDPSQAPDTTVSSLCKEILKILL